MRRMKGKKVFNIMKLLDIVAIALVVQTVNTACLWTYHQPEIPEKALKYRKQ